MSKEKYFEQLKQIETDPLWIGKYVRDLSKEISNNMWAIRLSMKLAQEITTQDFIDFLERVMFNRTEQIRKFNRHGMQFYVWFDMPEGQLRFNCISDFHAKLPFGNAFEITDDLASVVESFLTSPYLDGIPDDEEDEVEDEPETQEDESEGESEDELEVEEDEVDLEVEEEIESQEPFVLKVYVRKLR